MSMSEEKGGGRAAAGGIGCLGLIVTILVVWALLFGVSWNGRHYSIGCSCTRGVAVDVKP